MPSNTLMCIYTHGDREEKDTHESRLRWAVYHKAFAEWVELEVQCTEGCNSKYQKYLFLNAVTVTAAQRITIQLVKEHKRVCINIHAQHGTESLLVQVTLLLLAFCNQMHSNAHFSLPVTSTLTSCMVRLQSLPMQLPLHQCHHHHGNHSERQPCNWVFYIIYFLLFYGQSDIYCIVSKMFLLPTGVWQAPGANNIATESGPDLIPFKSGQSGEAELHRSVQETLTQHKRIRAQNRVMIIEKAECDFEFCPYIHMGLVW